MLSQGPARRVTIYINEDAQYHRTPLYSAILEFLLNHGVAGATASRAMAGFGSQRVLHTVHVEALAEHLPIRIEFVDNAGKVDDLLPTLYDMVSDGHIDVQETTVVKSGVRRQPKAAPPHEARTTPARLMRIYIGEADEFDGEPLYDAIVKRLRMMEISGATVYRGILGYGAKGHQHKERFLHLSRDLPVMIAVVDEPGKIEAAREAVTEMIGDGLVVTSEVEMIRVVRPLAPMEESDGPRDAS
jgi:PII-like signaling protein